MLALSVLRAESSAAGSADQVTRAIEAAVRARVGAVESISVADIGGVILESDPGQITAVPEPSARIGTPTRFVLMAPGARGISTRVGEATATIRIVGEGVRTRDRIARGATLSSANCEGQPADFTGLPFRPVPTLAHVLGARATRDLPSGALIGSRDVVGEPLIRAGQVVRAHVRIGAVELIGSLIAAESGVKGDLIRVVNQETRHARRGRVVAPGEVEVLDVP